MTEDTATTIPLAVHDPEPPAWEVCDDPCIHHVCRTCGMVADVGYAWGADDADLFLCDDCAGDVVAAYGDAHKLLIDQPPGPGEVSIRLLFSPDDGAAQLDAEITPEPADPEGEIALLEQAAVGLCAYLESYISAMRAESETA